MAGTASYTFDSNLSAVVTGSDLAASPVSGGPSLGTFEMFPGVYPTTVLRVTGPSTTQAEAIAQGNYFACTLSGPGQRVTRIQIKAARGGASTPRAFAIRSSADNYAANLASDPAIPSQRPNLTSYDFTVQVPLDGSVTFRVYEWAAAPNTSVEFEDLIFTTATVAAQVGISGSGVAALSTLTATAAASLAVVGAAALTLGSIAGAGAGGAVVAASAQPILQGITAIAAGSVTIAGAVAGGLGPVTTNTAAVLPVSGAGAVTVASIITSSSARSDTAGRLTSTLGDIVVVGLAGSEAQSNGAVAAPLSPIGLSASSSAPIAGAAVATLGQVIASGGAASAVRGHAAADLGGVTISAGGGTPILGAAVGSLSAVGVLSAATVGQGQQTGPIAIPARHRFVIPARQRRFTIPARPRSFLIRKGTCMQSITKYAAEERQYQADWSADLNGQSIAGEIAATSNDPSLTIDRVTFDAAIMKFWLQGGAPSKAATVRFIAPTSGGEDLLWEATVVIC